MDYKYIEQLLERYWQCETSLEEESELRAFFSKGEIPAHLLQYRDLFVYQQVQRDDGAGRRLRCTYSCSGRTAGSESTASDIGRKVHAFVEGGCGCCFYAFIGECGAAYIFANETLVIITILIQIHMMIRKWLISNVSSALMMLSEGINKSQDQNLADSVRLGGVDMINE